MVIPDGKRLNSDVDFRRLPLMAIVYCCKLYQPDATRSDPMSPIFRIHRVARIKYFVAPLQDCAGFQWGRCKPAIIQTVSDY